MVQQGIDQCAVGVARPWMHHEACGLIHHEHVLVFKQDFQRDVLGTMPVFAIEALGIERQSLATKDFVFGFHYLTIDGEGALTQPTGEFRAGIVRQQRSSRFINALACQRSGYIDFFANARRLLITHNGCNPTEFRKNSDFVGHALLHG